MSSSSVQQAGLKVTSVEASVVLLTHYLPLYQVRVFQELAKRVRSLKILLSTPIEPNRRFELDWGGLDVEVQRSVMFRKRWQHQTGFKDEHYLHFPYDTLALLRKYKPNVVMSHELGPRSMVAAMHRLFNRRSRLILMTYMSEHTEAGRTWMRVAVRKRLLNRADAVTYNGPSCRRYLIQQGVDEAKLFALPYAADDRVFGAGGGGLNCAVRDESTVRGKLVCVGQLNERKGVMPLLNQMSAYCRIKPHRLIQLTFVGQGPLKNALLSAAKPDNLKVEIIENLSPNGLADLYQKYGAAIHPTLADEWLMVVNESLHCGLPFLGSRYAQGVQSIIRNRVNGWIYDPLVENDLASMLDDYFLLSDDEIAAMRLKAVESVAERTPEWAARGAVSAIESVLA